MLGRKKDIVVETGKRVCIRDTQACLRVDRLEQGEHMLVHGRLVCARYKLACILGKMVCKLVLGSTAFELDIPVYTPVCIPAYTPACTLACIPVCTLACIPACIPACTPACTPVCIPAYTPVCTPACIRGSSSADNRVLGQQKRQQLKRR